ncbi:MAG: hypothetical protein M1837_000940 [Sclerophora amabilis]|nr:MAG: hypothetical protein M1837_000940 [Sclerophora amabilis]
MRTDPRIRQTWNEFSQNLDSANQTAQANLFTFSQDYLNPCLSSVSGSVQACIGSCFPQEERSRRNRARRRGRAETSFDFYDDWEDDDGAGDALLGGWDNDELDRLLAGSGAHAGPAREHERPRTLSYGARRDRDGRLPDRSWRNVIQPHDNEQDPTVIPKTSVFGFLGWLPWKIGGRELRYKPSAADLQDRPSKGQIGALNEPLLEESEDGGSPGKKAKHKRARSHTSASETTTDSFRSRGDLFPSEDEDDAVPLDDEFAMVLERRTTGSVADENSSRKAQKKKPSTSRTSTRTDSSRDTLSSTKPTNTDNAHDEPLVEQDDDLIEGSSVTDLKEEEEIVEREEDIEIERRRDAARKLASSRGLSTSDALQETLHESKPEATGAVEETGSSPPKSQPSEPPKSEVQEVPPQTNDTFKPAQLPNAPIAAADSPSEESDSHP